LHADPQHALRAGFERPILHGIATFSIALHAALRTILDYDATRFRSGKAKFVKPVFPGDTVVTEMWKTPEAILFRSTAAERNVLVVDGGELTITSPAT
jgi:acyl dehydratase